MPLTLLHSERPKLHGVFGRSECKRVNRVIVLLEQGLLVPSMYLETFTR